MGERAAGGAGVSGGGRGGAGGLAAGAGVFGRAGREPGERGRGAGRQEVPTRLLARIADDLLGHRQGPPGQQPGRPVVRRPGGRADLARDRGRGPRRGWSSTTSGSRHGRLAVARRRARQRSTAGSWPCTPGRSPSTMPPGADVLQRLLAGARQAMTVTYDPNCRPLLMGSPDAVRGRIESLVALADVVKASADDLDWLLPGQAPEHVAEAWLAKGPSMVVITLGPAGLLAATARLVCCAARAGWSRWSTPSAPRTPAWPPCWPACTAATCSAAPGGPTSGPWTPPPWPSWPRGRPGRRHHLHPPRRRPPDRGRSAGGVGPQG